MKRTIGLPRHIAFIMDGNGRWAEQRSLSRLEGHKAGVENVRFIVKCLNQRHIEYATIYAFSTENWSRPEDEVNGLFQLLAEIIDRETEELHKNGIRLLHLGQLDGLSQGLKQVIIRAIELTRNNTGMTLSFALNYGGRAEILDAVHRVIREGIPPRSIDEKLFGDYLYTSGLPDVDLVIRTGGEFRISNFLLWQAAYSEYYFTPTLWPDFNEKELDKALLFYSRRQRRFGGLGTNASPSTLSPASPSSSVDG
ncbi:polyprenyl diphosphate synthase [Chloroflexota bacterium]